MFNVNTSKFTEIHFVRIGGDQSLEESTGQTSGEIVVGSHNDSDFHFTSNESLPKPLDSKIDFSTLTHQNTNSSKDDHTMEQSSENGAQDESETSLQMFSPPSPA